MHVKFACAAKSKASDGEASSGGAACDAAPTNATTVVDRRRAAFRAACRAGSMPIPTRAVRALVGVRATHGQISADLLPVARATSEFRATILAGEGVRARKATDGDFVQYGGVSFGTPVRFDAPLAFGAAVWAASAIQRADRIEWPKLPITVQEERASARSGLSAFGDNGGSRHGAITLYDFKDSAAAVLDVVNV
jgi:hypothetical protein